MTMAAKIVIPITRGTSYFLCDVGVDDEVGWSFDVDIVDSIAVPVETTDREDGEEVAGLRLQSHNIRHHENGQKVDNRQYTHIFGGLNAIPMPALRTSKAATCAGGTRRPGGGPIQLSEKL